MTTGGRPPRSLRGTQWVYDRIDFGNDRLALVVDVVLAQGMAFKRIVHQDAAQVGMAPEIDSEHVEAFALEPVCRAPIADDARHPKVGSVCPDANLDAKAMSQGQRIQMVHDVIARLSFEPINRGQIG